MLALVVLAACTLAGCNPAAKLIGKWEADFSKVALPAEATGNPLAAMAASMMSSVKLQMEFKGDGTCTVTGSFFGQSNTTTAKWRYLKSEGQTLVLMVKGQNQEKEQELRVNFIDNDTLEMVPPEGTAGPTDQKLPFKRIKT
jgi:hypothetical protein